MPPPSSAVRIMDSPGVSVDYDDDYVASGGGRCDAFADLDPCAGSVTGTCRNLLAALAMAIGVVGLVVLLDRGGQSLAALHSSPLNGSHAGAPI